jgi:hypothetical protein
MRAEQDIRERHESELILWAGFESKMTEAARACWERIRILEWCLSDPTEQSIAPPKEPVKPPTKTNGSSDKLSVVRTPDDDDEGGDDE